VDARDRISHSVAFGRATGRAATRRPCAIPAQLGDAACIGPAPVVWTIGATGELIVATSPPSGTGCAAAWPPLADGRATVLG
jgi:hypothetical protein